MFSWAWSPLSDPITNSIRSPAKNVDLVRRHVRSRKSLATDARAELEPEPKPSQTVVNSMVDVGSQRPRRYRLGYFSDQLFCKLFNRRFSSVANSSLSFGVSTTVSSCFIVITTEPCTLVPYIWKLPRSLS